MTQMLLFDSTHKNTGAVIPVAASVPVATSAGTGNGPAKVGERTESNLAAELQQDSGLHHMGELARLVLLRYDLVAKRRAQMAARKAK